MFGFSGQSLPQQHKVARQKLLARSAFFTHRYLRHERQGISAGMPLLPLCWCWHCLSARWPTHLRRVLLPGAHKFRLPVLQVCTGDDERTGA